MIGLTLIIGRRTPDNDVLLPSRLLFISIQPH